MIDIEKTLENIFALPMKDIMEVSYEETSTYCYTVSFGYKDLIYDIRESNTVDQTGILLSVGGVLMGDEIFAFNDASIVIKYRAFLDRLRVFLAGLVNGQLDKDLLVIGEEK